MSITFGGEDNLWQIVSRVNISNFTLAKLIRGPLWHGKKCILEKERIIPFMGKLTMRRFDLPSKDFGQSTLFGCSYSSPSMTSNWDLVLLYFFNMDNNVIVMVITSIMFSRWSSESWRWPSKLDLTVSVGLTHLKLVGLVLPSLQWYDPVRPRSLDLPCNLCVPFWTTESMRSL